VTAVRLILLTWLFVATPRAVVAEVPATRPVTGITWDETTLRYLGSGGYARMIRLRDGAILLSCDAGGCAVVRRSTDDGATWGEPIIAASFAHGAAANAELLELDDGRVLLFYNERPRHDGEHPYTIRMSASRDGGRTWLPREQSLYAAGAEFANGCWEPAGVQLASGEVLVFFANEGPYRASHEQEITFIRSADRGETWTPPTTFAFRAGKRDGMPVPLLLRDGKTLVVAIEDEGARPRQKLQPAILRVRPADADWPLPITADDVRREPAPADALDPSTYAGAPFVRQLPTGETLLSCHSDEGGRKAPQMVVYIGDAGARRFAGRSVPFPLPDGVGGMWNSLFVKDASTVTALTSTSLRGRRGVWAIDGHVIRAEPARPAAAATSPPAATRGRPASSPFGSP
jgi:hypothetical protein